MSEITDLVVPILQRMQGELSELRKGQDVLSAKMQALTDRMEAHEGYLTYSLGLTARNTADIEALRDVLGTTGGGAGAPL